MNKRHLLPLIALLAGILACGRTAPSTPTPLPAGDATRTLHYDGRERSYILHTPPDYDGTSPIPVVLVFHGGGGSAAGAVTMTGFNDLADQFGFLAVYPNGTGRLDDKLLTWNGGTCCGYAQRQGVDDVGFTRAVIADLQTIAAVDTQRIYVTGMSNGGIMAYRLACEASDLIAAIGPVAGTQNFAPCAPQSPVSVIHFHGADDTRLPYAGGHGPDSLVDVDFASVADSIDFWVNFNGCDPAPQTNSFADVRYESYGGCVEDTAVDLYAIIGGKHAWPGSPGPGWPGGDEPTTTISASQIIWKFFAAHPKP